jgi:hypothetical protein
LYNMLQSSQASKIKFLIKCLTKWHQAHGHLMGTAVYRFVDVKWWREIAVSSLWVIVLVHKIDGVRG